VCARALERELERELERYLAEVDSGEGFELSL